MAHIQTRIIADIDPSKPVAEICSVIMAVTPHHPEHDEANILIGIKEAINKRLREIEQRKGDIQHEPIHKPERKQEDI